MRNRRTCEKQMVLWQIVVAAGSKTLGRYTVIFECPSSSNPQTKEFQGAAALFSVKTYLSNSLCLLVLRVFENVHKNKACVPTFILGFPM